MGKEWLISVIVPVYNTQDYLLQCMDSIQNQTYRNLEIVLVDDGSKDGSAALCDQLEKGDPRIHVIHKSNGGLMSAWITGVGYARGEYLCFVDSDDWIELDMIEKLVQELSGNGREIISSNYLIEKEKESIKRESAQEPGCYQGEQLEEIKRKLVGQEHRPVILSRCMKLISRNLIIENIPFCDQSIRMGEDVNIMLPALLDCKRLVLVSEGYYYHYRTNNESIVHRYHEGLYDNICLLGETIARILTVKRYENAKEMADREMILLMFLVIKNEIRGNRKNCRKRLKEIFSEDAMVQKVKNTPITLDDRLDVLMYRVEQKPGFVRIGILKFLFGMQRILKK